MYRLLDAARGRRSLLFAWEATRRIGDKFKHDSEDEEEGKEVVEEGELMVEGEEWKLPDT